MSHEQEFDLLELIRSSVQAEGLDAEAARRVEQAIQEAAGGKWTRVPKKKRHLREDERKQVYQDALTNAPTHEITKKHGIDRATLYRLVKRGG